MIPKAGNLIVHSGNIVNWNRLKRKPNQSPTEELSECVGTTLKSYLEAADKNALQYVTNLDCVHGKFKQTLPGDERGDLKVTVKLFVCTILPAEAIREAIERVLSEIDVTFLETALLSFPELENEDLTLDIIRPYWEVLEDLVHKEVILSLGMADLDKTLLEELYNWAEVKPCINQVNLDSCCVMPKDLVEYAKLNDIQLLTHNDPQTILPAETLQDVIKSNSTEKDGESWEPQWILRYSALIKCRGIITTKGYLMKAVRDVKRRK